MRQDQCCAGHSGLDEVEQRLLGVIQDGLPLVARPYAAVAAATGLDETEVIARISTLIDRGVIKRFGVVVRHHELGYLSNAMIVWNVPDAQVGDVAKRMRQFPFISLCYRRPRRPPQWPYNLYCMIHSRDRATLEHSLGEMVRHCQWQDFPHEILFCKRRFKQRGARYLPHAATASFARAGN